MYYTLIFSDFSRTESTFEMPKGNEEISLPTIKSHTYYVLQFANGSRETDGSQTATASIGKVDCTLTLQSVQTHFKMFEPCHIDVKINIAVGNNDNIPSAFDIQSFFSNMIITHFVTSKSKIDPSSLIVDDETYANAKDKYDKLSDTNKSAVKAYNKDHNIYEKGTAEGKEAHFVHLGNTNLALWEKRSDNVNGENFKCHSIDVSYSTTSSTSADVNISFYSPDIELTTSKFCKSYTKRSLSQIFLDDNQSNVLKTIRASETHLKNNVVLPYLVQYNESEYDFLRRTAMRCGEFLYFDRGQLQLGLDENTDPEALEITKCKSIKYPRVQFSEFKKCVINKAYTDGTHIDKDTKDIGDWVEYEPEGSFYDNELNTNEYLAGVPQEYTDIEMEGWKPGAISVGAFGTLLKQTSWANAINKTAYYLFEKRANAKIMTASGNNNFEEDFEKAKTYKENEDTYYYLLNDSTSKNFDNAFYLKTEALEREALNSTVEVEVGSNDIGFYLGKRVKLTKNNAEMSDNRIFVMTEIKQVANSQVNTCTILLTPAIYYTTTTDEAYMAKENNNIAPSKCEKKKTKKIEIQTCGGTLISEIDAKLEISQTSPRSVASGETKEFFPPYIDGISVRHSEPQTAFIASCDDPMRLGRVRIRYPWQTMPASTEEADRDEHGHKLHRESDRNYEGDDETFGNDLTPWIRVSTPSAMANKGGFFFTPRPGDEVLVNYIGGNVERPYVAGSLFSKSHKPKVAQDSFLAHCDEGAFSITGCHGHGITISEEYDSSSFMNGFNGALGIIGKWMSDAGAFPTDEPELAGAVKLSDKHGITNVTLDSGARSISIKSPLGDVNMSAFTGISIKAPNGDISIEGQNVSIKAGNKVKIESGTNIKNRSFGNFCYDLTTGFLRGTLDTVANFAGSDGIEGLFDISIVRTLVETIIRPVNGKLTLQSGMDFDIVYGAGKSGGNDNFDNELENTMKEDILSYLIGSENDWFTDGYKNNWYKSKDRTAAKLKIVTPNNSISFDDPNPSTPNQAVQLKISPQQENTSAGQEITSLPGFVIKECKDAPGKITNAFSSYVWTPIKNKFGGSKQEVIVAEEESQKEQKKTTSDNEILKEEEQKE